MRSFSSARNSSDLRSHPRDQVNRRAKVLDGPFAVDAMIKNISPGGALLSFPGRSLSGGDMVVIDLGLATAHACQVVWRKGPECGVRILKSQDLRGLVPGQFDPAKRLWQAVSQ